MDTYEEIDINSLADFIALCKIYNIYDSVEFQNHTFDKDNLAIININDDLDLTSEEWLEEFPECFIRLNGGSSIAPSESNPRAIGCICQFQWWKEINGNNHTIKIQSYLPAYYYTPQSGFADLTIFYNRYINNIHTCLIKNLKLDLDLFIPNMSFRGICYHPAETSSPYSFNKLWMSNVDVQGYINIYWSPTSSNHSMGIFTYGTYYNCTYTGTLIGSSISIFNGYSYDCAVYAIENDFIQTSYIFRPFINQGYSFRNSFIGNVYKFKQYSSWLDDTYHSDTGEISISLGFQGLFYILNSINWSEWSIYNSSGEEIGPDRSQAGYNRYKPYNDEDALNTICIVNSTYNESLARIFWFFEEPLNREITLTNANAEDAGMIGGINSVGNSGTPITMLPIKITKVTYANKIAPEDYAGESDTGVNSNYIYEKFVSFNWQEYNASGDSALKTRQRSISYGQPPYVYTPAVTIYQPHPSVRLTGFTDGPPLLYYPSLTRVTTTTFVYVIDSSHINSTGTLDLEDVEDIINNNDVFFGKCYWERKDEKYDLPYMFKPPHTSTWPLKRQIYQVGSYIDEETEEKSKKGIPLNFYVYNITQSGNTIYHEARPTMVFKKEGSDSIKYDTLKRSDK